MNPNQQPECRPQSLSTLIEVLQLMSPHERQSKSTPPYFPASSGSRPRSLEQTSLPRTKSGPARSHVEHHNRHCESDRVLARHSSASNKGYESVFAPWREPSSFALDRPPSQFARDRPTSAMSGLDLLSQAASMTPPIDTSSGYHVVEPRTSSSRNVNGPPEPRASVSLDKGRDMPDESCAFRRQGCTKTFKYHRRMDLAKHEVVCNFNPNALPNQVLACPHGCGYNTRDKDQMEMHRQDAARCSWRKERRDVGQMSYRSRRRANKASNLPSLANIMSPTTFG